MNTNQIIVMKEYYSIAKCKEMSDYIFVFGDNLIGVGKGGQAIIRDCPNAFGIPTKRLPSMEPNAFFSDQKDEIKAVKVRLDLLYKMYKEEQKIVFPADGIGTGLALLQENSPFIYSYIKKYFENRFKVHVQG